MELMDFEVVGVGGWSRKELERLKATEKLSLVIHKGVSWDQSLFAAALDSTLKWLEPTEVSYIIWPKEKWQEELMEASKRIFVRSYQYLGDKFEVIIKGYNQEVIHQDWLLVEHYRHLPMYLQQLKFPKPAIELVRFELMEVLLKARDMGTLKGNPNYLQVNPTLQVFDNQRADLHFLDEEALYLMYVEPVSQEVCCKSINQNEARLLDLLSQEITFNEDKLLKMILIESWSSNLPELEWCKLVRQMKINGLLI